MGFWGFGVLGFMIRCEYRIYENLEEGFKKEHPEIHKDLKIIQSMSSQDKTNLTLEDCRKYVEKLKIPIMRKYESIKDGNFRDDEKKRIALELFGAVENILNS